MIAEVRVERAGDRRRKRQRHARDHAEDALGGAGQLLGHAPRDGVLVAGVGRPEGQPVQRLQRQIAEEAEVERKERPAQDGGKGAAGNQAERPEQFHRPARTT